jgi:glycerol-3-phosphate acyltransferase PlsX
MNSELIAVDVMGGDNSPHEIVKGAIEGANRLKVNVCLVGDEESVRREMSKNSFDEALVSVRHAPDVITNDDPPAFAVKNKKNSSMAVALGMVKNGEAAAVISAGSTGALMAGGLMTLGRIKGIERPALAVPCPAKAGAFLLIDCGANADVKPQNLVQFAQMGSIYMEHVHSINKPRIGLINVGTEETKGSEIYKETHGLLKECNVNFVGNIEGSFIMEGLIDVLVCDGFVGNIILKQAEGLSKGLFGIIKEEITSSFTSKLAASVLKKDFKRIKKRFDPAECGGAPLLGLKGLVVKAHGSSDAWAVYNAVRQCDLFMKNNIIDRITKILLT